MRHRHAAWKKGSLRRFTRKAAACALALGLALQSALPAAFSAPAPLRSVSAPAARSLVPDFPAAIAAVDDAYDAPGSSKTLFLLQDAHTNNSGQMNVARTLDLLLAKTPVRYVFLEAGSGDESLSFLRRFAPLALRKLVAKAYLLKGQLQGTEYLDLTSEHAFTLWGVEDAALYARSLDAYRAAAADREALGAFVRRLSSAVDALRPEIYNPYLLSFEEKARAFADGSLALGDYSEALEAEARRLGFPSGAYPALAALARLRGLEAAIDFAAADAEQRAAVASLSEEDRRELFQGDPAAPAASRLTSADPAAQNGFFAGLAARLEPERARYPELFKYLDYRREAGEVRPKALVEEQAALENEIYAALAGTADERALAEAAKHARALERLAAFELTPAEFAAYAARGAGPGAVRAAAFVNGEIMERGVHFEKAVFLEERFEEAVARCEEFYALTAARDEAFVRNLVRKMDEEGERAAVLVAGGYHGPNLKALFRRRGISYVSVVPQVTHETNRKRYEDLLLRQELDARASGAFLLPARGHMMLGRLGGWDPLRLWPEFEAELVEAPRRAEAEAARLARAPAAPRKAAARLALPADAAAAVREWKATAERAAVPSPLHVPATIHFFVTVEAGRGWENNVAGGDGLYGKALPPLKLGDGRSIVPVVGDLHEVASIEATAGLDDPADFAALDAARSRLRELTRVESQAVPDQALYPGLLELFELGAQLEGYPAIERTPDHDEVAAVGAETLRSLLWILHEKGDMEFRRYAASRGLEFEALVALSDEEIRAVPGHFFWRADNLRWEDYYREKTEGGAPFPHAALAARRHATYPKAWSTGEDRNSPYFDQYRYDVSMAEWFGEYAKLGDYLDVRLTTLRVPYRGRLRNLTAPPSLSTETLLAILRHLRDRDDPVLALELKRMKKTFEALETMPRRALLDLGILWARAEAALWSEFYGQNAGRSGVEELKARRDARIAGDELLRVLGTLSDGLAKASEALRVRVNVKRFTDAEIRERFGLERVTDENGRAETINALTFRDVVGRLAFLYGPWGVVEARSASGAVTTLDSPADFLGALERGDALSLGRGRLDVKAFGTIAPKVHKFEDGPVTVTVGAGGTMRPAFKYGFLSEYDAVLPSETTLVLDDGARKAPVTLEELLANPGVFFGTRYQPGFPSPAGTEVTGFSQEALRAEKRFAALGAEGPYHTFSRFGLGRTHPDRPAVAGSLRLTREDDEPSMRVYEAFAEYDADPVNSLIGRWKSAGVLDEKLEDFFRGLGRNYFALFALGKTLVNMGTGRYIHMGAGANVPPMRLSYDFFVKNVDLVRGRAADLGDYMSLEASLNDVDPTQDTVESVAVLTALVGELLSELEKKGLADPAERGRFYGAFADGFVPEGLERPREFPDGLGVESIRIEDAPDGGRTVKTRARLSPRTESFLRTIASPIKSLVAAHWNSGTVYYDYTMQASIVRRFVPDLDEGSPFYGEVAKLLGNSPSGPSVSPIAKLLGEARRAAGFYDIASDPVVTVEPNIDDAAGTAENRKQVAEKREQIRSLLRERALTVEDALDRASAGKALAPAENEFLSLVKAVDRAFRAHAGAVRLDDGSEVPIEEALARLNDARARAAAPGSAGGARLAGAAEKALTARGAALDALVAGSGAKPGDRLPVSDGTGGPWVLSFAAGRSARTLDVSAGGAPFRTVDVARRPAGDATARAVSEAVGALRAAESRYDRLPPAGAEKKPIELYLYVDAYEALPEVLRKSVLAAQFGALGARRAEYRAVHLVGSREAVRRALEAAEGVRSLRGKRALFVEGDAPRHKEAKQVHVVSKSHFLANEAALRADPARRFVAMDDVRYDAVSRTAGVFAFNPVFSLVERVGVMDALAKEDATFAEAYAFFKEFTGYALSEDDFIDFLGGDPALVERFALPPVIRAIDINLALRVWAMAARLAGQSA